jgi:hypothetical protein
MDESSPILVEEQNGTLRIAWDNRRVRNDRAEARSDRTFWIVCALLTLLFTGLIFVPDADVAMFFRMPFIMCAFFGWLLTIGIPFSWITKTWSEWIDISKDSFCIGKNGFLVLKPWRVKTFPLNSVIELAFGSYVGFGSNAKASTTLQVIRPSVLPGNRQKHAGYWLSPALRVQVLKTIKQFVDKNQIPLKITRYGLPSKKTARRLLAGVQSKPAEFDKAFPIEVLENDQKLRLRWDNKRVGRNDEFIALSLVLAFWTSVTTLVTYAIFRPDPETNIVGRVFCAVWCIGGWGFALFLTHHLAQRLCTEWMEVSAECLSHRRGGLFFRGPMTLALDSVNQLGITQSDSRREYAYRLRISFDGPSGGRLRSIGYWMEPDARKQVFQIIEDFVARKQIPLRVARYGP